MPVWHTTIWNIPYYVKMTKSIFTDDHLYVIEKLKEARLDAGMNQEDVADMLGKTQSYLSKIEAGQRRIDIPQLREFSRLYKKDITYFIKD